MAGRPTRFADAADANSHGIGMVFQEQSLLTNLSVGENICLGNERQFTRFGLVDWRELYAAAATAAGQGEGRRRPAHARRGPRFRHAPDGRARQGADARGASPRPSSHPARRADLGSRAGRDRHPVRARAGAEVARLVRLRLPPARRGAGAERPHLCDEGRRGGRRTPCRATPTSQSCTS